MVDTFCSTYDMFYCTSYSNYFIGMVSSHYQIAHANVVVCPVDVQTQLKIAIARENLWVRRNMVTWNLKIILSCFTTSDPILWRQDYVRNLSNSTILKTHESIRVIFITFVLEVEIVVINEVWDYQKIINKMKPQCIRGSHFKDTWWFTFINTSSFDMSSFLWGILWGNFPELNLLKHS